MEDDITNDRVGGFPLSQCLDYFWNFSLYYYISTVTQFTLSKAALALLYLKNAFGFQ